MNLTPYRLILRLPGLRSLMAVGLLARIPATAAGLTITLHVVTSLGLGYGEAGLAGALGMVGAGIGAPLVGRLVDRFGARPVIAATTLAQAIYWPLAPSLGYPTLLVCAAVAGAVNIPIFSVMRQFIAAVAPPEQRRTAFAIDSITVELSYLAGPALAVAGVTGLGSTLTLYGVGAGLVLSGLTLFRLNPPTRSAAELAEAQSTDRVPRRQWFNARLAVLLSVTSAGLFVLAATELSIVASLREAGATEWTGLVIGVWCAYSIVGGFVYGALHRSLSPLLLVGAMGALTVPLGLVTGGWWWLMLAVLPAGLLCSPSLAATVDTVSSWVPSSARGEAMGLHGTALTIGVAAGAPVAGAVIDAHGPAWGYAVAGCVGVALVAVAIPFWPRRGAGARAAAPGPAAAAPTRATPAPVDLGLTNVG